MEFILPLHGAREQYSSCFDDPSQDFPPCAGGGESQSRPRERLAAPHVAEHSVHMDHMPHCPSTKQEHSNQS